MNRNPLNGNSVLVAAVVTVLMLCANALGRHQSSTVSCTGTTPIELTHLNVQDSAKAQPVPAASALTAKSEEEDKVRQVARDFIKQKFPGAKVDGISALPFWPEHLYLAGGDTTHDGNRYTIDLLVRSYTRRNGSVYWLPTLLSESEAAKLRLQMAERH